MLRRFVIWGPFPVDQVSDADPPSYNQNTKDAIQFYNGKVEELGTSLKDLESIIQGKSNNLRVVEDGERDPTPLPSVPFVINALQCFDKRSSAVVAPEGQPVR